MHRFSIKRSILALFSVQLITACGGGSGDNAIQPAFDSSGEIAGTYETVPLAKAEAEDISYYKCRDDKKSYSNDKDRDYKKDKDKSKYKKDKHRKKKDKNKYSDHKKKKYKDRHKRKKKQIKVRICHMPPGNPANARTLIVGLPAIIAHLRHGCGKKRKHHDYMGPCIGDPPDAGEEPNDGQIGDDGDGSSDEDNGTDDGSTDDGGTTDEGGDTDGGSTDDGGTTDEGGGDLPVWCQRNIEIDADCDGFHDETGESLY